MNLNGKIMFYNYNGLILGEKRNTILIAKNIWWKYSAKNLPGLVGGCVGVEWSCYPSIGPQNGWKVTKGFVP